MKHDIIIIKVDAVDFSLGDGVATIQPIFLTSIKISALSPIGSCWHFYPTTG